MCRHKYHLSAHLLLLLKQNYFKASGSSLELKIEYYVELAERSVAVCECDVAFERKTNWKTKNMEIIFIFDKNGYLIFFKLSYKH